VTRKEGLFFYRTSCLVPRAVRNRTTQHVARTAVLVAMMVAALSLAACGRKGTLVPPEALVPAAVTDLTAEQKGERFLVSWTPPSRQSGGGSLTEPTGFSLVRRFVLPPGEDCEECPDAYRPAAEAAPDFQPGVRRIAGRYYVDDADLKSGATYQYKVVSFKADRAASPPSNRARRRFVAPPAPPVVKAVPSPTAIELVWPEPPRPAEGELVGYHVYRSRAAEPFPPRPVTAAPLTERRYEDIRVERGVGYRYAVRSVARVDGETVESVLSNDVAARLSEGE
jgi:predicted small lipoprotein YifL